MSAFGIDLGTTNSVISWLEGGVPKAIAIDGAAIVPSAVLFAEDGSIIVGQQARNLAILHPERTALSVKRAMGRSQTIAVAGRAMTPAQISAEILAVLKRGAEQATGEIVSDVVITVPAWFDEAQRQATLDAAKLAGLSILRLLNEPTAASLVYDAVADVADATQVVLVYDLGGGTLDVSVLEVAGDIREVRATAGDTNLGGDDFDRLVLGLLRRRLQAATGLDVRGDAIAMARLQRLAEETKIALSSALSFHARAEFLGTVDDAPVHLDTVVRRDELDELIRPHLERTIDLAHDALAAAGAKADGDAAIDRICMVGGSTRIPLVRALLSSAFVAEIHEEIDVDLAVSHGAAIQAGLLTNVAVDRILIDVTAHDVGIRIVDEWSDDDDRFAAIVRRNTALPARGVEQFHRMFDDQKSVEVEVFQGNTPRCSTNRLLGSFEIALRSGPEGEAVAVTIECDSNGMVRITANQEGGDQRSIEVQVGATSWCTGGDGDPVAAHVDSPVERKARTLRDSLSAAVAADLDVLLVTCREAMGEGRTAAEEALLDFILDHDS